MLLVPRCEARVPGIWPTMRTRDYHDVKLWGVTRSLATSSGSESEAETMVTAFQRGAQNSESKANQIPQAQESCVTQKPVECTNRRSAKLTGPIHVFPTIWE